MITRLTPNLAPRVAVPDLETLPLEEYRALAARARPMAEGVVALAALLDGGAEIYRRLVALHQEHGRLQAQVAELRATADRELTSAADVVTACADRVTEARSAMEAELGILAQDLETARRRQGEALDALAGEVAEKRRLHDELTQTLERDLTLAREAADRLTEGRRAFDEHVKVIEQFRLEREADELAGRQRLQVLEDETIAATAKRDAVLAELESLKVKLA